MGRTRVITSAASSLPSADLHELRPVAGSEVFVLESQPVMMPQVLEGRLEIADVAYATVFLKILGEGVDEIPVDLSCRRCNT